MQPLPAPSNDHALSALRGDCRREKSNENPAKSHPDYEHADLRDKCPQHSLTCLLSDGVHLARWADTAIESVPFHLWKHRAIRENPFWFSPPCTTLFILKCGALVWRPRCVPCNESAKKNDSNRKDSEEPIQTQINVLNTHRPLLLLAAKRIFHHQVHLVRPPHSVVAGFAGTLADRAVHSCDAGPSVQTSGSPGMGIRRGW